LKKNKTGFREKFIHQAQKASSFLCVGLDSDINKIPKHLKQSDDPIFEFNKSIIDATKDIVCAYKPNLAFYAAYGLKGYESLIKTVNYIPESIPVILDAKMNDIGNTAEMYAASVFNELQCDSVTFNPYMGFDSIEPFTHFEGKSVFALCLTSNSGSKDFQYMISDGKTVYEQVMNKLVEWKNKTGFEIGAVVGATHSEELKHLREIAPDTLFLIPGIGSQGGDLEKVCKYSGIKNYLALINVSRNVIYAGDGKDFATEVKKAAIKIRDEINSFID
jgi:orotidine-5'-phosphate decarboxylase